MRAILFLFIISLFGNWSFAQESGADDFSDYSYLWETKKDKKKKKKTKEEQQPLEELDQVAPADTLKKESTNVPDETIPGDTLKKDEPAEQIEPEVDAPQVEEVDEPESEDVEIEMDPTDVEDAPNEEMQEPDTEVSTDPYEAPDEPKQKKERADPPQMGDFRSGMAGSSGGGSNINGGLTVTNIDGQYFVGLVLNPELNLGKVGVGLNVPILYGLEDQKVRTEIFKDGVGIARLITYVRYGIQKSTPVYVKVGQLNNTMIGFGGLINNYTNTTSFEKRTIGLHYDVNYKGLVGLEGMYSDFSPGSFNLFAIRPYVRPLIYTGIPIVRTFEIGTTIIKDKDQTSQVRPDTTQNSYLFTKNGVGAFGIDAGVTLLKIPFIQIDLFANYSRLNLGSDALTDSLASATVIANENDFKNGNGISAGINFRFHFIADVMSTDVRIERLNYSDYHLPQFFDATYQIDKDAKIYALGSAQKMSGIYGSLTGQILQKVQIGGSLMIPDEISTETPAVVRVNANLDRLADKFSFHGSYIKGGLTDLNDAFTFDNRSLAKLRVIYHLNKFLATGMDYYYYWVRNEEGEYKATQYVSPYFGLSISF